MALFNIFKKKSLENLIDPSEFASNSNLLDILLELYETEIQGNDVSFQISAQFNLQLGQYIFKALPSKSDCALTETLIMFHSFLISNAGNNTKKYVELIYLPFKEVLSVHHKIGQDEIHEIVMNRMNSCGYNEFVTSNCAKLEYLIAECEQGRFGLTNSDKLTEIILTTMSSESTELKYPPLIKNSFTTPIIKYQKEALKLI